MDVPRGMNQFSVGTRALEQKRYAVAEAALREALREDDTDPHTWTNLGSALMHLDRDRDAIECYQRALEIDRCSIYANFNLGNVYKKTGEYARAIFHYYQVVAKDPSFVAAYYNIGTVYSSMHKPLLAGRKYAEAIRIDPQFVPAYNNLAVILQSLHDIKRARNIFELGLSKQADHVELGWNLAMLDLLTGNYSPGWAGYELRWHRGTVARRHTHLPPWDGSYQANATLLVYTEQGAGDEIQFVRFLKAARKRVGRIVFECRPDLFALYQKLEGPDLIVPLESKLPEIDLQVPLMSLPLLLGIDESNLPGTVPYLYPGPDIAGSYNISVPIDPSRVNIGIVWGGNPKHSNDQLRSCNLDHFQALTNLPHIQLYSLQKGERSKDLAATAPDFAIINLEDYLTDFASTAAVISRLDLVISVDTAVAHLAGALARPAWVLLPFAPDWRWQLDRPDSPWYPTVRIFRQPVPDDWAGIFTRLQAALRSINKFDTALKID